MKTYDSMKAMMTKMITKMEEVLQHQEQQEAISLMTTDDKEDNLVDTESIDDAKLNLIWKILMM